ncbi:MAG TPA: hypothetical protein VGR30_03070 [Candidatus Binatia bacterium]|jgi:hypothetical protein|nr:hypothetical protein [Candidatus Binatia bacterium]
MNVIEEIKAKLQKYPHAQYEADGNSIRVLPTSDDGFTVSLITNRNTYTVSFDGWHEDFHDKEEALNCFVFGLSTGCRLKEFRRGRFTYKWIVEAKESGRWVEYSETGLLVFPFWMKETVRYLQNDLISGEREEAKPDI